MNDSPSMRPSSGTAGPRAGIAPLRKTRCVGLALGGGAAFGGMHLGVIQALEEAGVPIDVVAGTSAGAFVGAFLAGGMSATEMIATAGRLRWSQLRRHLFSMRALFSNDRMVTWLEANLPVKLFDAMPKPFAAVAADLLSGSMVVLTSSEHRVRIPSELEGAGGLAADVGGRPGGPVVWSECTVAEAIAASSAIPVIFEPVRIGERMLVDGGVVSMVPASVARWLGADVVIAVDILPPHRSVSAPRTILEYAVQAHRVSSMWGVRGRTIHADVVLRPRAIDGHWNDMGRTKELVRVGHDAATNAMPDILQATRTPAFTGWSAPPALVSAPRGS